MTRKKIGDYLVEAGIVDKQTIQRALDQQLALEEAGGFKPLGTILHEMFGVATADVEAAVRHMAFDVLLAFDVLSATSLFSGASRKEIESAIAESRQLILKENEPIFCQGDGAHSFFIIVSGKVKIFVPSCDGTENVIATIGAGEVFGEMALVTGEGRTASAKTMEHTSLLEFSKEFFGRLYQRSPEQPTAFIQILVQRLIRGNEELVTASENERTYQQLLSERNDIVVPQIIGKAKAILDLREEIKRRAQNDQPVLIYGEPGTEKLVAAEQIHTSSNRANTPFLNLNAEEASLKGITLNGTQGQFQQEIIQASIIFGHKAGAIPSMPTRRIGLLEICKAGTLVIENIDRLTEGVQQKLLDFLKTGTFTPFGSVCPVYSGARIIATAGEHLKNLAESGKFNQGLFALLNNNAMTVPPLRKRKSDLRMIVNAQITWECNKDGTTEQKQIRAISEDAYQRIMQYDWPGNMEELAIVIRRATNLAQHETLLPEDIFIGMAPPSGKHTFNLLRLEQVHNFFCNRKFPVALQIFCVLAFLTAFLIDLTGNRDPNQSLSLIVVWSLWWPMLVVSWFLGARIWCAICPMGALNDLASSTCSLKLKVPLFIRNYGLYLCAIALGGIFLAEEAFDMIHSPGHTALLLLTIASCALLSGLLFERRLWCRYLCPMGHMAAIFSSCSVVECRSNMSICNTVCKTYHCFTGTDAVQGCPLYLGPFSLKSNHNCILCGKCIKACEHASPTLNLRVPGHELWAVIRPDHVTALFVPVIVGTQLFRGLNHSQWLSGLKQTMHPNWAFLTMLLLVATALSFAYVRLAGDLSFGPLREADTKKKDLFCFVIIPVAFAFELGYRLAAFFSRIGHIFPAIGRQFGTDLDFLDFSHVLGPPLFRQLFLVALGACASIFVLARLMQKHHQDGTWKLTLLNTLPITFLTLVYFCLLISANQSG